MLSNYAQCVNLYLYRMSNAMTTLRYKLQSGGLLTPGLPQTDVIYYQVITLNGVLCNENHDEIPLQLVSSRALR